MDKQKIKSVPKLTTDNPVDNFQAALNFTDSVRTVGYGCGNLK